MIEQLTIRMMAEPSFMKLFAEIYAIEMVATDQKIRFNTKTRFGWFKKILSEKSKTNVTKIENVIKIIGIKASLFACILIRLIESSNQLLFIAIGILRR